MLCGLTEKICQMEKKAAPTNKLWDGTDTTYHVENGSTNVFQRKNSLKIEGGK